MKLKNGKKKLKGKELICKAKKYEYGFQQCELIKSFGDSIYTGKINIDEAEMDQSKL